MTIRSKILAALAASAAMLPLTAQAQEPASCETVRLSDPGWTDINATNAIATELLTGLGYQPNVRTLSVPIGYEALKNGEIDVFLGNWMPSQTPFREDLEAANAIEELAQNLEGAKFTLAVPSYVAEEGGVTSFSDLAEHAEEFSSTIYGIEPGAPANQSIQEMIDTGDFNLGDWSLVSSSEQGMLSQVSRAVRSDDWIVFLAWAPHPMNNEFDITYLAGGDEYFGPDFGGARVYTLARTGYSEECPNVADFFSNLVFTVEMENELMGKILDDELEPAAAAKQWLKDNPEQVATWLEGVETLEGEPGLPAVEAYLEQS